MADKLYNNNDQARSDSETIHTSGPIAKISDSPTTLRLPDFSKPVKILQRSVGPGRAAEVYSTETLSSSQEEPPQKKPINKTPDTYSVFPEALDQKVLGAKIKQPQNDGKLIDRFPTSTSAKGAANAGKTGNGSQLSTAVAGKPQEGREALTLDAARRAEITRKPRPSIIR